MSLGPKILLSIFSLSLVIATIGVTSNWYTNSILNQLVQKNVETTSMVEQTAKLENRLYQSLILLIELKESRSEVIPTIELQSPTEKVLIQNFGANIAQIKSNIIELEGTISAHHELYHTHLTNDFEELKRNFQFYEQLSIEWLEFRKENKSQSHHMFSNSLTPYFSNNIIPAISHLREDVMNQQIQENSKLDIQLKRASIFIIVITIILIFLSLGVALFIYNSIVNPLKNLSVGAHAFGKGNLDERVEVKTNDEIGNLTSTFNTMASNLQKRTLARDYLDNIIESIQETLIVTDEQGDIVGLNKSASDLLAYKKKKLIGKPLTQLLDEELANLQHNSPKAILEHTIETTLTTKHGRKIPVLFSESDLINSKDEFVGKVVVATDITERNKANARIRASLKEKEILLAEIHHRVKNNLAVISGILELQSQSSNNKQVEEALTDSQTRIKSISLVHEMLYQSDTLANINYKEYVDDLIVSLSELDLVVNKGINFTTDTEELLLDLNIAVPCSMLLSEIIVDRLKNSFDDCSKGNIHIVIKHVDLKIELSVEHNGKHSSMNSTQMTLGYTLIKTLINQLGGTYYEEYLESRKVDRIRIVFPINANND